MKLKWFLRISLSIVFIITACNIFNPSGEGSAPESDEGQVLEGQVKLREQDWDGAMEAFAQAIEEDSTNSLAYYSYAKAVRFKYNLNGITLSQELTDTAGGKIPFLKTEDAILSRYLQATVRLKPVLSKLAERDSLTRWKNYLDDPIKARQRDKYAERRMEFIQEYLHGNGYQEGEFPLIDGLINFEKILPELR